PTPTPSEEPPVVEQSSGGGGGGYTPSRIIFSGEAFPGATLGIYLMGEAYGQVLIDKEFKADDNGDFYKEVISSAVERRFYGLLIKDKEGKPAKSKFYTYDLRFNSIIRQQNIIFAPTIKIDKTSFSSSELILVKGFATPGNKVEMLINGKVVAEAEVESQGSYQILMSTENIPIGKHRIQVRQFDSESDKTSDTSEAKIISISDSISSRIDLNRDSIIDISDWSVFLFNWSAKDEDRHFLNDLNRDGKVDLGDFSIFLTLFQLGRVLN
ncbi:MAG: hypothetical protein WD898_00100, partial [Candidatus Paceibacterota bacterium]